MNKWQREVLGNRLASEETILKEIRDSYKQALKEIDDKVAALLGRLETEEGQINKQAIDYQLGYQKALQTQIKAILETMNTNQFETISEYLKQSYEDGFIGTMYDLQKQGIPLTIPMDQQQVVRAIKTNSKLSKDLWGSLAEDNSELQVQIRSEISSGISQGRSYSQIARQLAERMSVGYSKTARIVRTESHRISQEATLDAQYKAKETGADIVKQWDASIDRRTRSTHAQLDGQIREIDEPFEYGGHKAMHPSGFGVAALDINCRCVIVQRAKWALDEEELKVLEDRAKYFGLDKAKDFEEYKKKYLESLDEIKEIGNNVGGFTAKDTKNFQELQKHMMKNYNINITDFVKTMRFESVRDSMAGIEFIMNEFPQLRNLKITARLDPTGIMATFSNGGVSFNPEYYKKGYKAFENQIAKWSRIGHFPKNYTISSLGAHEAGHIVEAMLCKKAKEIVRAEPNKAWENCLIAEAIFTQAWKNVWKVIKDDDDWYTSGEGRKMISKYALESYSETLAEAFGDVYTNRENAQFLSKEIWKVAKEWMGKYYE